MTEQERKMIEAEVGRLAGEVAVALGAVVAALRQQPGFDNAGFDALLKKELSASGVGATTKRVYKMILGEPLE